MPVPRFTRGIATRTPESYLRGEIAAYPLASEAAFHLGLTELDPALEAEGGTRALWRQCEEQFASHTGWSLDSLVAARDRGWFGAAPQRDSEPIAMKDYLRALARYHLVPRAGVTILQRSTELPAYDTADHYRWLTFALPEDLILAGLGINPGGVEPVPVRVDVEPPLLVRRLFDLGMAEVHHHVGAGMSFPLLWASAMAALALPEAPEHELVSPGAPLAGGRNVVRWLLVAAVFRCVASEFLIRGGGETFGQFIERFIRPGGLSLRPRGRGALMDAMRALETGQSDGLPDFEALHELYADMHPTAMKLRDRPLEEVGEVFERCDPIAVRLGLTGPNVGERWFMRNGFDYLDQPPGGKPDRLFTRIFWQIVRVRCQYYRAVVERPLTAGLQWFIRFSERLGGLRAPLKPILPQVSYAVAGDGERVRALEIRHSAPKRATAIGEEVLGYLKSWQRVLTEYSSTMFEPEFGIVYNFVKLRDPRHSWPGGTPPAFWRGTHAEPDSGRDVDVQNGRYADYFADQSRAARALAELIQQVPSVLWVIRGLDVASDEMAVPTWVLVPLYRHVVDVSARVSLLKSQDAGPPLKLTAHVGEDFRHLLEGMRRIYEQVHYVLGGEPGRLGHAIALGLEPETWADSVGTVLMPAEERLWDLVWEWRLYSKHRIMPEYWAQAPEGRIEEIITQVRHLSAHIYGRQRFGVEELAEAHHVLHCFLLPPYTSEPDVEGRYDTFLRAAHTVRRRGGALGVENPTQVAKILGSHLTHEDVFLRGQKLVEIAVRDEVQALSAVQNALRNGIGARGIVVEVNPSSNLLIGDMRDLRAHPVLRLSPPIPEEGGPPPVPIALGSDDPIIFSTRLLREYTLLHQTACAAGYPERVVQDWLEGIRSTGMDARFTTVWNPTSDKKIQYLIARMHNYLNFLPPYSDT